MHNNHKQYQFNSGEAEMRSQLVSHFAGNKNIDTSEQ